MFLQKILQQYIPWAFLKSPQLRMLIYGDKIDCILYSLAITKKNVFFVQVGSNDASHGDPLCHFIHKWNWAGIMIEPVEYVFKRLEKNFSQFENIILENVAVSSESGVKEFYHLAECDDLPITYNQLGSFLLETVLKNSSWIPDIKERIVTTQIKCLTFQEICRKNHVSNIDILHIDTEGYDFEIIKMIDFECVKPMVILYEHKHLNEDDKAKCRKHLERQNYELIEIQRDTIALQKQTSNNSLKLCQAWDVVRQVTPSKTIQMAQT
ncbi:FkbM family methyltransferase [Scytonema sp. NUACC26]|uniref:FkbM family methyltransferase n=1 Tax=Scytonema sp. NUACC26 TaxID=3140176 RepID=UPI0038B2377B